MRDVPEAFDRTVRFGAVDLVETDTQRGTMGVGTVHHVAFEFVDGPRSEAASADEQPAGTVVGLSIPGTP